MAFGCTPKASLAAEKLQFRLQSHATEIKRDKTELKQSPARWRFGQALAC
jgi:hypothetical protein